MLNLLKRLHRNDEGQDMIEYALLSALIAVVLIVAIQGVATAIEGVFGDVETGLDNA